MAPAQKKQQKQGNKSEPEYVVAVDPKSFTPAPTEYITPQYKKLKTERLLLKPGEITIQQEPVVEYSIQSYFEFTTLQEEVNTLLNLGWKLYGYPGTWEKSGKCYQALIREVSK